MRFSLNTLRGAIGTLSRVCLLTAHTQAFCMRKWYFLPSTRQTAHNAEKRGQCLKLLGRAVFWSSQCERTKRNFLVFMRTVFAALTRSPGRVLRQGNSFVQATQNGRGQIQRLIVGSQRLTSKPAKTQSTQTEQMRSPALPTGCSSRLLQNCIQRAFQ